jgi:hypothetical protein
MPSQNIRTLVLLYVVMGLVGSQVFASGEAAGDRDISNTSPYKPTRMSVLRVQRCT